MIQPSLVAHLAQAQVDEEPTDSHQRQADHQHKHQQAARIGAEQRLLNLPLAVGVDPVFNVAPCLSGSRPLNAKQR